MHATDAAPLSSDRERLAQTLRALGPGATGAQMRPAYEQGATLADLARHTHWAPASVRSRLIAAGTRLRRPGARIGSTPSRRRRRPDAPPATATPGPGQDTARTGRAARR